MAQPQIVDRASWQQAADEQLAREKELTRLGDQVSAARRRLPMTPVQNYIFAGPDGPVTLLDLFGDAEQLIIQHFMFDSDWDAGCPTCSNLADSLPHTAHFAPYGIRFVRISRAPVEKLTAYSERMGWREPWVSAGETSYNDDWGWTRDGGEVPGVSFLLKVGEQAYLTYSTTGRGVEPFSSEAGYLDRTIYGRQETWEDSPAGWPQTEAFSRTRRHDEY